MLTRVVSGCRTLSDEVEWQKRRLWHRGDKAGGLPGWEAVRAARRLTQGVYEEGLGHQAQEFSDPWGPLMLGDAEGSSSRVVPGSRSLVGSCLWEHRLLTFASGSLFRFQREGSESSPHWGFPQAPEI